MNLHLAFLVAVLVLFTANCVQSEDVDCEIYDSDVIEAANNAAMKKCNSNIKSCFNHHKEKDVETLYCRGMMVRFLCPLSAALLSLFFFVVPFFFGRGGGGGVFSPSFNNAPLPFTLTLFLVIIAGGDPGFDSSKVSVTQCYVVYVY